MNFYRKLGWSIAALALAGLAIAAAPSVYTGFSTLRGAEVDISTDSPTIAMTGQTISAQKGGANTGSFVATGATTGASTLTFTDAMPSGRLCGMKDVTTTADTLAQTAATDGKTVVTFSGTIVSGDKIFYECHGF